MASKKLRLQHEELQSLVFSELYQCFSEPKTRRKALCG